MDVAMKEQLVAAGMPAAQADVLASHMPEWPDWSQFATKADLEQLATKAEVKADLKELELNLRAQMGGLRDKVDGLRDKADGLRDKADGHVDSLTWKRWVPASVLTISAILNLITS